MSVTLRFADELEVRTAAVRLRKDIERQNLDRYGRNIDAEADPVLDGRTLCVFRHDRILGSVDLHWGGDGDLPAERAAHLRVPEVTGHAPDQAVVLCDEIMWHPDARDEPVDVELLAGAGRFAVSQGARWVFATAEPSGVGRHRDLGFRPCSAPVHHPALGYQVAIVLDLADVTLLEHVKSPFAEHARSRFSSSDVPSAPDGPGARGAWRQVFRQLEQAREHQDVFLGEIESSEIGRLLLGSRTSRPAHGSKILEQGTKGRDLYLVLAGQVEVRRDDRLLCALGPGELFGEIGFLSETPRTADVVAVSDDVAILALAQTTVEAIIHRDTDLGARLAMGIARSLGLKLALAIGA